MLRMFLARLAALALVIVAVPAGTALASAKLDETPRTVVMTAYAPEWNALSASVDDAVSHNINGWRFLVGTMEGKPVVLMETGVSIVNAAMNTQLAIERFNVKRIVFSGVAGGVNPAHAIGDVLINETWAQYMETAFGRLTKDGYVSPDPPMEGVPENWEFIFPRGVYLGNAAEERKRHIYFPVDAELLELANDIAPTLELEHCVERSEYMPAEAELCLPEAPQLIVGGIGVTAPVYMDNAQFRKYLFRAWKAEILEMESGAVSQVAYANQIPVIHIRGLSDLAGGDRDKNASDVFEDLAAVNAAKVLKAYLSVLPD